MPNTRSAIKRTRSSAKKGAHNSTISARLKTLEKKFNASLEAKNSEVAATELRTIIAAFDKASKSNVVHKCKADRKKSRLTKRFNTLAAAA
jgi:small subunit ribosomal protein S20